MKTKKEYEQMSDQQINERVAIARGNLIKSEDGKALYAVEGLDLCTDFCNSWADAGPIIQKNFICVMADVFAEPQDGGMWMASPAYGYRSEAVRDDNPLRAAMILFLMSLERIEAGK